MKNGFPTCEDCTHCRVNNKTESLVYWCCRFPEMKHTNAEHWCGEFTPSNGDNFRSDIYTHTHEDNYYNQKSLFEIIPENTIRNRLSKKGFSAEERKLVMIALRELDSTFENAMSRIRHGFTKYSIAEIMNRWFPRV